MTFIPETTTYGTAAIVEVTFPNGATGELVYPAELELASGGIHPLISVRERPDIFEFGPQRQLWALHGRAEAVLRTLNEGHQAEVLATYERARRYDMDDQVWPDRDFLAARLLDGPGRRLPPRGRGAHRLHRGAAVEVGGVPLRTGDRERFPGGGGLPSARDPGR